MLARSMLLALTLLGLPIVLTAGGGEPESMAGLVSAAFAQDPADSGTYRAVDRVSVAWPVWRRGAGLLYGSMTFKNGNPYPVWNVIVACDFFDQWGNPIGTRATMLRRVFGPGRARISGIYFTVTRSDMEAGACRVISAIRYPLLSGPA